MYMKLYRIYISAVDWLPVILKIITVLIKTANNVGQHFNMCISMYSSVNFGH